MGTVHVPRTSGWEHVVSRSPAHEDLTPGHVVGAWSRHADEDHVLPWFDEDVPRAEVAPEHLTFHIPAHHGFAGSVGHVVEAAIAQIGRGLAAGTHLEASVVAMADALIPHAAPWSPLEVSIAVDDTDAYVRLTMALIDRDDPPQLSAHVRGTLRRNVQSYDVLHDGNAVTAVLQVPLEPAPPAWA